MQDAHEAIRPSHIELEPDEIKDSLSRDQYKLYKLIWNRFLAKWILPKMRLICARGKGTLDNLKGIGIEKNVKLCADGAFTMADDPYYLKQVEAEAQKDAFFNDKVVGLSISSVVRKKCDKLGIDYPKIMTDFIDRLNEDGWNVLIIANGARIHSDKPRLR